MSKEKKVPKAIKEFYDRHDKLQKLLDNTEIVHSEAFHKGLSVLRDEKGEVDYKLLDDTKNQDKFLDKLMDHYISSAVKSMGLKSKPKDALEQDIMLRRYGTFTRGELKGIIRGAKSGYKLKQHEGIRDELIKKQTSELMSLRGQHMEESDIGDILKHVKVGDYVSKDVGLQRATGLLEDYRAKGEISVGDLAGIVNTDPKKGGWGSDLYLTDKGKKAIKDLRDQYKKAA